MKSDHAAIHFRCKLATPRRQTVEKRYRKFRFIDKTSFLDDVKITLNQHDFWNETDVNQLAESFNDTIRVTLDTHAPIQTPHVVDRKPTPWYTSDIRQQKHETKRAEK